MPAFIAMGAPDLKGNGSRLSDCLLHLTHTQSECAQPIGVPAVPEAQRAGPQFLPLAGEAEGEVLRGLNKLKPLYWVFALYITDKCKKEPQKSLMTVCQLLLYEIL